MTDQDKKDQVAGGEIKAPERNVRSVEQAENFNKETVRAPEVREISPEEKDIAAQLRREIEVMELSPDTQKAAEIENEKLSYLGEPEKIERLLQVAREKGLVYAIQVAKSMNEPYILDTLHDFLVKGGFYKKLVK